MKRPQLLLWYAQLLIQTALLLILIRRQAWREWPWFTAWIGVTLTLYGALVPLQATHGPYTMVWEIAAFADAALFALTAIEYRRHVTSNGSMWWAVLMLIPGLLIAALTQPAKYPMLHAALVERATVGFLVACGCIGLMLVCRPSGTLLAHGSILAGCAGLTAVMYCAESLAQWRYWTGTVETAGYGIAYGAWCWWMGFRPFAPQVNLCRKR